MEQYEQLRGFLLSKHQQDYYCLLAIHERLPSLSPLNRIVF